MLANLPYLSFAPSTHITRLQQVAYVVFRIPFKTNIMLSYAMTAACIDRLAGWRFVSLASQSTRETCV
jgi:hypothetical protein